ncbi:MULTISPECIES: hypothetical protein [unclassified Endozoicomonas]|nr:MULTISPECIES: hypothetical protein [unclassified Endozoicomonas]
MTIIGEGVQLQQCGKVCKNAKAHWEHKRRHRKRKPVDVDQDDNHNP